jgi:hypothetical protein
VPQKNALLRSILLHRGGWNDQGQARREPGRPAARRQRHAPGRIEHRVGLAASSNARSFQGPAARVPAYQRVVDLNYIALLRLGGGSGCVNPLGCALWVQYVLQGTR